MIPLIIYFVVLLMFFAINFKILQAINIETIFKKNKIWQIHAFYVIVSLVFAHLIASIVLKFYEWVTLII